MALSFNGIPWSNFRGICLKPYEINTTTDAKGDMAITDCVKYWKNQVAAYPLQFNFVRVDSLSWNSWLYGGTIGLSILGDQQTLTAAQYEANVDVLLSALDSAGINCVLNSVIVQGGGSGGCLLSLNISSNWQKYYQNATFWGTEPQLQGMSVWDAEWQSYVMPLLQLVDHHPCVVGYKFANEPGGGGQLSWSPNPSAVLQAFGNWWAAKMRTVTQKPIIFQTQNEQNVFGTSSITSVVPNSAYAPFLFSAHYPSSSVASIIQSAVAGGQVPGCIGWYDDEDNSDGLASILAGYGIPGPLLFGWYGGSLLDSNLLPTSSVLSHSSTELSFLGPAQYFSGGGSPVPTVLTLTAKPV